jgi:hypothetical protein
MLLLRLLIILLICYIVITALKSILTQRGTRTADRKKKFTEESEDMVLDPQCQSYIPKASAVAQSGKFFCSRECAQRYLSG